MLRKRFFAKTSINRNLLQTRVTWIKLIFPNFGKYDTSRAPPSLMVGKIVMGVQRELNTIMNRTYGNVLITHFVQTLLRSDQESYLAIILSSNDSNRSNNNWGTCRHTNKQ